MKSFAEEFRSLHYVIRHAKSILLFAHTRPDADTVGATIALAEYLSNRGKQTTIACFDPFPNSLAPLFESVAFVHPDTLTLSDFDAIFACDSVDRGFDRIHPTVAERQIVVLLDHHADITAEGDITIIDPTYSSTCEILFSFFETISADITPSIATALLAGLVFDTGNFQHICTTPRALTVASALVKRGAPMGRVVEVIFANKSIPALRLWGRAFEKALFYPKSGMLLTTVTQEDITACQASAEDIYHVASVLSTVPEAKFALVLSERDEGIIRGSFRATDGSGVDVSALAHRFGGGGHRLASGFEIEGSLVETPIGWTVV